MPRNASGSYTLPAGNPVISGEVIASTWANPTMSDLGNEVEASLSRTGKGGMLAPLKHVSGSQGAPSVTFSSEPQSGWYRAASGDIRLAVGGVDVLRVKNGNPELWIPADGVWYSLISGKTSAAELETQTLATSQTVVEFTANVAGAAFYVDGTSGDRGRLFEGIDFTYDAGTNEVTLTTSYPAGTVLMASFNDESAAAALAEQAAASAMAAAASELAASLSEAAAEASEIAAGLSETNAEDAAAAAALSEIAAAASQSAALISANNAAASENVVTAAETNVVELETLTEEYRDTVVTLIGLYQDGHQGAHPTAPTTRNDGSPLQEGDYYYNTTSNKTFVWDGA